MLKSDEVEFRARFPVTKQCFADLLTAMEPEFIRTIARRDAADTPDDNSIAFLRLWIISGEFISCSCDVVVYKQPGIHGNDRPIHRPVRSVSKFDHRRLETVVMFSLHTMQRQNFFTRWLGLCV